MLTWRCKYEHGALTGHHTYAEKLQAPEDCCSHMRVFGFLQLSY